MSGQGTPPTKRCWNCGTSGWWWRALPLSGDGEQVHATAGNWLCNRCHPEPSTLPDYTPRKAGVLVPLRPMTARRRRAKWTR